MGMRTAGNLPFVEPLIFCIITAAVVHWRAQTQSTHTQTHTSSSCAKEGALPLQSLRSVHKANGRRRQIRGGTWVLLQRDRMHIGRAFNLPPPSQIEHPRKMTSRGVLWPFTKDIKTIAVPDQVVPNKSEVVFHCILGFSMSSFV
ncbi:hypothetical protein ATANTOWER_019356 [Ataeniobius toweri]|uniref:Secreted protein n=1 Tax=Ataeniobius toweri TaxID=208326 RepID=A0ABU7AGW4_9TELE|nr:hypothetical protein [Ataeniobius toweri]